MDCIIAVAEKPSIADAIAKALASSPITTRSAAGVRTHEFQGRYEGRQREFRVTSVSATASRWTSPGPPRLHARDRPAWDAPVVSVPTSGGVLKNLRETASGGDALILFLDCDREGEAIAFQVIVAGRSRRRGYSPRQVLVGDGGGHRAGDAKPRRARREFGGGRTARQELTCAWAWLYTLLDKHFLTSTLY